MRPTPAGSPFGPGCDERGAGGDAPCLKVAPAREQATGKRARGSEPGSAGGEHGPGNTPAVACSSYIDRPRDHPVEDDVVIDVPDASSSRCV